MDAGATPSAPSTESDTSHLRLLVRTQEESCLAKIRLGSSSQTDCVEKKATLPETVLDSEFHPGGSCLLQVEETPDAQVVLRDARTGDKQFHLRLTSEEDVGKPVPTDCKVSAIAFSPSGDFVQTWARRGAEGGKEGNLVVWSSKDGKKLAAFHQKSFWKDKWPFVQWSDDESIAVRSVSNEVHVYDGKNIAAGIQSKVMIPGIGKVCLSRGPAPYRVAAFVPENRGTPPKTQMYRVDSGELVTSRTMFRADNATFKWHPNGSSVLTWATSDTDATGKSYYGESNLFFADSLGKLETRVELPREGGTHDVAWSPNGQGFIVIYGYMPAQATLFSQKCEPIFDFGTGARNTVSFSPHGRFVALGGFGNLAGHVEFWDKNRRLLIGTADMSCTTSFCWSPCSRFFLSATTFPRLRVDNCYRLFKYNGTPLFSIPVPSRLHQARFLTLPTTQFPDRPASPGPPIAADGSQTRQSSIPKAPERKAYRPPGMRNGNGPSFSLHEPAVAEEVTKKTVRIPARKPSVPGADVEDEAGLSKSQIKNKRKKEKAQMKKTEEKKEAEEQGTTSEKPSTPQTREAAEKRLKALSKKLKQIDVLKADEASGKELLAEQKAKVAGEANTRKEKEEIQALLDKK